MYKCEKNEKDKIYIKNLIDEKVQQSRIQWFIKKDEIYKDRNRDLFTRMLAEIEGIQNMDLNEIERPFNIVDIVDIDDTDDTVISKKKLGIRHDL